MISVKVKELELATPAQSACQLGWFPERETQELLAIIDLMWNGFSCPENVTSCVNSPVTLISQVIERFYPCVKLGHILVSFEAKPESKMMMKDFHISKKMPHSPKQKVKMHEYTFKAIPFSFARRVTSAFFRFESLFIFLLNGKGIDKRVNISMVCGFHCFLDMFWKYLLRTLMQESGPQLPTNVTALLNLGANLLQAIGCFGGFCSMKISLVPLLIFSNNGQIPICYRYIQECLVTKRRNYDLEVYCISTYEVIRSFSRMYSYNRIPRTPDQTLFVFSNLSVDCDIIEGPSRISLSCPISYLNLLRFNHHNYNSRTRIKLPVKGHVCKHLQCFDFWNYVNMNTRRHHGAARIILEEVGRNAADVVISADGTWMVETENDEDVELVPETTHDHGDPNSFINLGPTVKNPARDENEMETSTQVEEHNPCLSEIQGPSNDTHRPASDYTMLNQSHTSTNTLPQLPRTLNAFDGQQFVNLPQVINTRDSPASQALPMTFSPTPSPQDILATNAANFGTSMPAAQSSQFQGSHVTSLGNCEGRTSDLMARWNHIYGRLSTITIELFFVRMRKYLNQSPSPAQQRPVPSYIAHPQTFHVNYGENADQRWMPSSIAHPQTLPVNYGGNTNQRPIPSSIAHPQTLPVNYRGNTDHRSTPYSITHLQTLLNYGGNADQRPMPSSITNLQTLPATYGGYAHQRPMSSSITHPRTSPVNYGGTPDQRPMPSSITHPQTLPVSYGGTTDQILNPGGAMGQFSSREFMNLTPANTENWRPQSRMRGSVAPGTGYDHMIIHPTRPVHPQAQTPPAPLSTSYDGADEIQAFIGHPSYPVSNNETQAGSFWSMPPETW
ncbi:Similar to Vicia transcription factor (gb/X97908) [Arabidopsis thaliana]|nr:Similar to Vicia transcription factor (gb/X97908) [Arabidopsis thaliana]